MISWEPWDSWQGGVDQPAYALKRIVAGDHDALIDRWARQIAGYRRPVMLRLAAEMNGDWRPWSTGVNGNGPGEYVGAWRHVRARFRRAHANNAVWVWNPIVSYDGATALGALFPGSTEVDWLAVDGHNWGSLRPWGWQSYADIVAPTVRELAQLGTGCRIRRSARRPGFRTRKFDAIERRLDGEVLELREISVELSVLNGRFGRPNCAVAGGVLLQLVAILVTRG